VSLRAGIEHEVKSTTERIEGRVFSNAPHSVFVEMGTGPVGASNHMGISPNVNPTYTTRKSWAFPIVIDGEETFRTTSGQPARPFMYPAAQREHTARVIAGHAQAREGRWIND
jgi:hypothetical protein